VTTALDVRVIPLPASARSRRIPLERLWWVPLAAILVAQAVLSIRLIGGVPASDDEGRYIYSGHQLIYELWHGGGSPYYETYFSGAPVIYPILAAMVDHVAGLTGVRLMSLEFMLAATSLLFATSRRLFGYWPGIAAAGLFAGLGLTQALGVYATYDGMSLMLMAIAAYIAVRIGGDSQAQSQWLLLLPLALVAANVTKYMTVLFDPVIIGIAAIQVSHTGRRRVRQRLWALSATTAALLLVVSVLGGTAYIKGVMFTTLDRQSGIQQFIVGAKPSSPGFIVSESWRWTGLVIVMGILALIWAAVGERDKDRAAMIALLTIAGMLVTFEALHLHSDQSMRKHDDFGIWFTCIAAGALVGYAPKVAKPRVRWLVAAFAAAAVVIGSAIYFSPLAPQTYAAVRDPGQDHMFGLLRPYLATSHRYLLGGITDNALIYTEHLNIRWYSYFDDVYIKYPIPGRGGDAHGQTLGRTCLTLRPRCMYLEGPAGYRAAIHAHWFAVISMTGAHPKLPQDALIEQYVEHTPGYVLLTRMGGAPTWIYAPDYKEHGHGR
jgi:hypothetical protein